MTKRVSLILDPATESAIRDFAVPGSPAREALETWAEDEGLGPLASEASVWRSLLRLGALAARESALDRGYARLAGEFAAPEEAAERRAARDRYARRAER
jgi:hypothetical protein